MASTYTTAVKAMERGGFPAVGPKLGLIENEIDLTAVNSGVFVDGDVITALSLPAGTLVLAAGLEVTTAVAGAAQCVCNLGYGDDTDRWVNGGTAGSLCDIGSSGTQAAVGSYTQMSYPVTTAEAGTPQVFAAADTIDLVLETITGAGATLTAGKVRVWALVVDVDGMSG